MVDAGVATAEEAISTFNDMKMNHNKRFIIYRIEGEKKVLIEHVGEKDQTYEDFAKLLPADQPRFAVVDYPYEPSDRKGTIVEKLLFFHWCPENSSTKNKMLYASTKESFKSKLVGIVTTVQCADAGELDKKYVDNYVKSWEWNVSS